MTAASDMTAASGAAALEVVTLELQGEIFALEAAQVREILDLVPVTEVPNSRPFVNGLINVRGKVVPLADLRLKFGMAQTAPTIDTRIVVIDTVLDGEPITLGILADKVHDVTEVAASALEETPKIGMRWRAEFIRWIAKRDNGFVIVVDIGAILSHVPSSQQPTQPPNGLAA